MEWRKLFEVWLSRKNRELDFERELQTHLDLEAEEQRQAGAAPEEASYAARRAFGNTALIREDTRAAWGWAALERVWRDLRYAARMVRRKPAFATVAVLSLAIALAANTAVFSFARAIVFKQLPVSGAERLVIIRQQNEMFHMENCCFPYSFWRELRKRDSGFEDVLAVHSAEVNLTDAGQTERLQAEIVSGNYFAMLGIRPALGRLLDESDDETEGAGRVCVISHRLWQERFGATPEVVGRRVLLNAEPFLIVGVSQAGFAGASLHQPSDIQLPASMTKLLLGDGRDSFGWAELIARLKPGLGPGQAQARLNTIGKQIEQAAGQSVSDRDGFLLRDGSQGAGSKKEQFGKPVLVLLLLVAVVLLVACANLAALLLVRSVERMREAGMRMALGVSRHALFQQFLTESLLLAAAGGIAGWLLARILVQALLRLLGPQSDGLVRHVAPDVATFAFSAGATLASGVLFGVLPAWRAAHSDPIEAIRGPSAHSGRRWLLSRFIVAAQIALSLALLFCAGLFVRTLRNLRLIDLGFNPEQVTMLRIDLSRTVYRGPRAAGFYRELLHRARQMPGARSASLASISVLSGSMQSIVLHIPGYVPADRIAPVSYFNTVSSGYFRTLGVPLLAGRDFLDSESGSGERAVIVNQQFARTFFAGDALGKTLSYGGGVKVRVAGIVGTAKFRWLREDPHPVMYLPVTPGNLPEALSLQVRTLGDPAGAMDRLRGLVRNLDPGVPVDESTTLETQIDQALARERLLASLSTFLAATAVALAAIGLYSVLSFSVVGRRREIGIRMAVGAERQRIVLLFLKENARVVLGGIAVGVPLAWISGRLASSLLYGLKPQDLEAVLTAAALLACVALAASAIPAWRASRIDPVSALRNE